MPGSTRASRRSRVDLEHAVQVLGEVDHDRDVAALAGEARCRRRAGRIGAPCSRQTATVATTSSTVARDDDADRHLAVVRAVGRVERAVAGVKRTSPSIACARSCSSARTSTSRSRRGGVRKRGSCDGAGTSAQAANRSRVGALELEAEAGPRAVGPQRAADAARATPSKSIALDADVVVEVLEVAQRRRPRSTACDVQRRRAVRRERRG